MTARIGGVTGWLLARFRRSPGTGPRLELVERIALGPRQWLSLVEAEGSRILVATSAEGGPAFYPLERVRSLNRDRSLETRTPRAAGAKALRGPRVSW